VGAAPPPYLSVGGGEKGTAAVAADRPRSSANRRYSLSPTAPPEVAVGMPGVGAIIERIERAPLPRSAFRRAA